MIARFRQITGPKHLLALTLTSFVSGAAGPGCQKHGGGHD